MHWQRRVVGNILGAGAALALVIMTAGADNASSGDEPLVRRRAQVGRPYWPHAPTATVLSVGERVTDLSARWTFGVFAGLHLDPHTRTNTVTGIYSLYADTTSTATPAVLPHMGGIHGAVHYTGTGTVELADSGYFGVANLSTGTVRKVYGVTVGIGNYARGVVEDGYALFVRASDSERGGQFLRNHGVYIEDQSAAGTERAVNLYSAGRGSTNIFEGSLQVKGALSASTVRVRTAHPTAPDRELVHAALAGPEAAVYFRGEARLVGGEAIVALPSYFESLTRKDGRTVQLTPVGGWTPLYVVDGVKDGRFTVRADGPRGDRRFYWEVRAVRADTGPLTTEPPRAAR